MELGCARFRVWGPRAGRMRVQIGGRVPSVHEMRSEADGWWALDVPGAGPGSDYGYVIDDDAEAVPDPASRWQPYGVQGLSRVYDQDAFGWTDARWTGRPLAGAVIYELHVATFTPGATFDSAILRLGHLAELGVTHVELLPVNAVDGVWNWGYDGVGWYAVHEPLGGPDGLKRFVDACHGRGMAVVLDVVYNHLGPAGDYLPRFGPYLKGGGNSWGELINVNAQQSGPVRRFIVDNALMWLADFHFDGLRLDAVQALSDTSTPHLLAQLAVEVDALSAHLQRPLTLIAESDLNDPIMITPREAHGYGLHAQWDDDVHHALHALLTGERQGYYCDFGSLATLAKVLTHAFFHDGTYSGFRQRRYGAPIDRAATAGYRFVVCLQNHDQVGNRAAGKRLSELTTPGLLRVGAVLLLTAPFTPMLWMGQEWAASTRWPYFSSHRDADLAKAISKGRAEEFSRQGWDPAQLVDPQDPQTYYSAVLDWDEPLRSGHTEMLDLYRRLIALRRAEPHLSDPRLDLVHVDYNQAEQWLTVHRGPLRVAVNLADHTQTLPGVAGSVLLATDQATRIGSGLQL
ncbi:MAG: malto-oligosyltrehalose trehalohydrolase, partial [Actinomycetota bacterium]|nr:malto-oligosyltrehalose trehalohydrolase [Actinomycetota bacterium]